MTSLQIMSGPAVNIRRASACDTAAMDALMQASGAYHGRYGAILNGYKLTALQIERDWVYVAEEHEKLIGFYSFIANAPEPELDLLFVSDGAQGRGIGSALVLHLKELAASAGIRAIRIVSHPPALDFYLRMGATIVGCSPAHGRVTWDRPVLALQTGND